MTAPRHLAPGPPEPRLAVRIADALKREAVVLLPAIVSGIQAANGQPLSAALPLVAGLVLRTYFTSPQHEVSAREALAFEEGKEALAYLLRSVSQDPAAKQVSPPS